jgi:hypothetical protein
MLRCAYDATVRYVAIAEQATSSSYRSNQTPSQTKKNAKGAKLPNSINLERAASTPPANSV